MRIVLFSAAIAAFLASPAAALAQTKLIADVGLNDGFTITLKTEAGATVGDIPAGAYEIEIRDHSDMHNFHLTGPGVNVSSEVAFIGTVTRTVTLTDAARYTFVCDMHPSSMRGTFTTGGGPPKSPPPPPPPPPSGVKKLTATVGPGNTITLRTASARQVTRLTAGRYRIVVRDRSAKHNFHLSGPGVNKRTAGAFRGTQTWTVTFRKGATYRYVSDGSPGKLRGSFRAT